ncbi:hypothetical protein [Roseospira navarrensis]|uniref:hypothetical protein n=1 Tax=Roseospira navarrensis TaxID=140058 RepID=UPI0014786862|nr:hypothetical protein [Roseospira navarrensis]
MSMQDNKYVQAAQEDFDALKRKWSEIRGQSSDNDNGKSDSQVAETAWKDFQDQSEKVRAAGGTASTELRGSYEAARDKFKKVVDAYRGA